MSLLPNSYWVRPPGQVWLIQWNCADLMWTTRIISAGVPAVAYVAGLHRVCCLGRVRLIVVLHTSTDRLHMLYAVLCYAVLCSAAGLQVLVARVYTCTICQR
jgi:hypothetical protein